ncbi:MAG TPA: class I SAM-dependent methyltransferase [Candidatus Aquilonibacter sp.]|nr:class I SAM-dependent methyltransferase [Candidatus Aquilonibacter sp.]
MASAQQLDTDRSLIESFVRRGLFETKDFASFWGQFVGVFTCELHRLPNDEAHLKWKQFLAIHWLQAFLCNFYEDSPDTFYWRPGKLRQSVYHAAMDMGVQILPMHPYSPAPDPRRLPRDFWTKRSDLPGLRIDLAKSCDLLRALASLFRSEYEALPPSPPPEAPPWTYYTHNDYYDDVDGYILYAIIRHFRPRRIVEIGSGNTTYLSAQAAERNRAGDPNRICDITAIEPYPNPVLRAGFPGLTRLIPSMVQDVPLSLFEELSENDILFIDSSHVVRTGSDVLYEILEILPRLRKGVLVHLHDIFLPREYPREWTLNVNRYWTEQYLLQAFLAFNDSFEILLPTAYVQTHAPQILEECFPGFPRNDGWLFSNFWLRKQR